MALPIRHSRLGNTRAERGPYEPKDFLQGQQLEIIMMGHSFHAYYISSLYVLIVVRHGRSAITSSKASLSATHVGLLGEERGERDTDFGLYSYVALCENRILLQEGLRCRMAAENDNDASLDEWGRIMMTIGLFENCEAILSIRNPHACISARVALSGNMRLHVRIDRRDPAALLHY